MVIYGKVVKPLVKWMLKNRIFMLTNELFENFVNEEYKVGLYLGNNDAIIVGYFNELVYVVNKSDLQSNPSLCRTCRPICLGKLCRTKKDTYINVERDMLKNRLIGNIPKEIATSYRLRSDIGNITLFSLILKSYKSEIRLVLSIIYILFLTFLMYLNIKINLN